jgi:endonuclease YncB( thermonuclease family)
MDRYGRFLCYLDKDNTPEECEERQLTYNERMLQEGYAAPYIIWPNTDPFIQQGSVIDSVPDINSFQQVIRKSKRLNKGRDYVKEARDASKGIFNSSNPLLLLPFELRYLARRSPPDRYVLDISLDLSYPQNTMRYRI